MGFLDFLSNKKKRKAEMAQELNLFVEQIKARKGLTPITTTVLLKEGEKAYLEESSTLLETRAVRYHSSGGAGFRVMKGVYVGGSKGTSESKEEWRIIDKGTLTLTNERLIFDGKQEDRVIPLKKIISAKGFFDSIEISSETRKKSILLTVSNAAIWSTTIQILIKNGGEFPQSDGVKVDLSFQ